MEYFFSDHNKKEWEVIKQLESGVLGTIVYEAKKIKHYADDVHFPEPKIVIKQIEKTKFGLSEIYILERLKGNPHSIKYYGCGKDNDNYYIYVESTNGAKSINDYLSEGRKFSSYEIIKWATKIVLALQNIHQFNIVHCDIKCEHIIIFEDDVKDVKDVKFIDFGVSKEVKRADGSVFFSFTGTQKFMAPEVKLQNGQASCKSDIYSLGCVLIEMADGDLENTNDNGIPIVPDRLPYGLRNIIQRCLLLNVSDRFSANDLHSCLLKIQNIPIDPGEAIGYGYYEHSGSDKLKSIPESIKYLSLPNYTGTIIQGTIPKGVEEIKLEKFNQTLSEFSIPNSVTNLTLSSFNQPITIGSIPDSVTNLILSSFNQPITIGSIPDSVINLTLSSFNQPITIGSIPDSVTNLTLSSFNQPISIGSIPSSVKSLSFRIFNQNIEYGSIPESVTYLDLGDEFDIQNNGYNLPDYSVVTLRCGFKFTEKKILNHRSIPLSVSDLQLYNYNIPLARNSIPKSVISLTLGSNFDGVSSLTYLPLSIINLKFGIDESNVELIPHLSNINNVVNHSITSLIINDKERRM